MKETRTLRSFLALVALIFLLDRLYRYFHPVVNLERATIVGLSAFLALFVLSRFLRWLPGPFLGGFSVFCSAFFSVLLIQHGYLVSQSSFSGFVHVVILAVAFAIAEGVRRRIAPVGRSATQESRSVKI